MQCRFELLAQLVFQPSFNRLANPCCHFLVHDGCVCSDRVGGVGGVGKFVVFCDGLVFLGDDWGFEQRGKPWMTEEHGICGSKFGRFVQTALHKVSGWVGKSFGWKVGRDAIHDSLEQLISF